MKKMKMNVIKLYIGINIDIYQKTIFNFLIWEYRFRIFLKPFHLEINILIEQTSTLLTPISSYIEVS